MRPTDRSLGSRAWQNQPRGLPADRVTFMIACFGRRAMGGYGPARIQRYLAASHQYREPRSSLS
jgi:hypothetical protein